MAKHVPGPFSVATTEEVGKIIGELFSGSELTRLLAETKLPDPHGEGMTKWKRLAAALQTSQVRRGDGGPVIGLIHAAMAPDRTLSRRAEATVARDELNQVLSLTGYRVKENGRIGTTCRQAVGTASPQSAWGCSESLALKPF